MLLDFPPPPSYSVVKKTRACLKVLAESFGAVWSGVPLEGCNLNDPVLPGVVISRSFCGLLVFLRPGAVASSALLW